MFARVKKFKNKNGTFREYLYIVDNTWKNGQPKQKTIANLGRLEQVLNTDTLDKLAQSIANYTKQLSIIDYSKTSKQNHLKPMVSC
jgi:hypothetical protein